MSAKGSPLRTLCLRMDHRETDLRRGPAAHLILLGRFVILRLPSETGCNYFSLYTCRQVCSRVLFGSGLLLACEGQCSMLFIVLFRVGPCLIFFRICSLDTTSVPDRGSCRSIIHRGYQSVAHKANVREALDVQILVPAPFSKCISLASRHFTCSCAQDA